MEWASDPARAVGPALGRLRAVQRAAGGIWASPWAAGLVALLLRLFALVALGYAQRPVVEGVWGWGTESASLGHSLYRGDGLGDVFSQGTGPSAWLTPVYPALIALCMTLFGGPTAAAAAALYTIQSIISALAVPLLFALGRALGLERAGRTSGWLWAFYPLSIWHAVHTVWDTTLIATAVLAFVVLLLRAGPAPKRKSAALLGLAFGAVLLVNPAPAAVAPVVLIYLAGGMNARTLWRNGAAFGGAAFLVVLPWLVRNSVVLGAPVLRGNLGVEALVGNNDEARGRPVNSFHPSRNAAELAHYRELGEIAYAHEARYRAEHWVRDNPWRFVGLSARRVAIFWLGEPPFFDPQLYAGGRRATSDPKAWIKWPLGLATGALALVAALRFRRGHLEGLLVRGAFLLLPLPYYVTHVSERYRMPLEPLIVFLAVWLVIELRRPRPETGTASRPAAGSSKSTS